MKILVVSQRFYPENFRINDIVESLVGLGHSVTVLCGLPNYPKGYIYEDYKNGKKRNEFYKGAKVIRAKEIGRRNNIIFRFLNYYSFPFYANLIISKLPSDYDVVFVNQLSPIMMVIPAIKYKKNYNKKIVMYSMDLWPESLLAGGIKEKSLIYKYYAKVSKEVYESMDSILVSSKGHIDYLHSMTRKPVISYLPQYSESIFSNLDSKPNNDGIFTFVFAGNVGKAQNLSNLLDAVARINTTYSSKFEILIVGDGSEKKSLEGKVSNLGLNNVKFIGQVSQDDVIKYYKLADCMIVSLENSKYASLTVPGKVQSYMAARKPILSIASGETNQLIKDAHCGLVAESNDVISIASRIVEFINSDQSKINEFADNAKKHFENNFKKDLFMKRLIQELEVYAK